MNANAKIRTTHGLHEPTRSISKRATWSRFASPRAEVSLTPSNSRANLFAGD